MIGTNHCSTATTTITYLSSFSSSYADDYYDDDATTADDNHAAGDIRLAVVPVFVHNQRRLTERLTILLSVPYTTTTTA